MERSYNYGEPMEEYGKGRGSETRNFRRLIFGSGAKPVSIFDSAEFIALFNDLGAGVVDTSLFHGVGTATFTRATAASAKLSTGLWKLDVASGSPRSSYLGMTTAVGAYGGYLAEGARTNLCLQSRDLSNASWTKVNTTGAKDQTGIDGVANSASSLTATLGGGTCLQTITEAATDSTLSMFIKRITGTGTITIQQGASTSEISAQVNSTTYTQVSLDATVLNPAIGIVLGTNGDKIAVDCVQFENGAFASTPIPTTTVAVTRNADTLTYLSGALTGTPATMFCQFAQMSTLGAAAISAGLFEISDGTSNNRVSILIDPAGNRLRHLIFQGGVATVTTINPSPLAYGKTACAASTGNSSGCLNAGTVSTDATAFALGTISQIAVGMIGGGNQGFSTVSNARIWLRRIADPALQAITT